MGNMIAIHNIVAVCSVLRLANKEGEILTEKTRAEVVTAGRLAGSPYQVEALCS